jgi:hypothetical protein
MNRHLATLLVLTSAVAAYVAEDNGLGKGLIFVAMALEVWFWVRLR